MPRTRAQNETIARAVAQIFRSLLHQVSAAAHWSDPVVPEFVELEDAMQSPNTERMWKHYLAFRNLRERLLIAWGKRYEAHCATRSMKERLKNPLPSMEETEPATACTYHYYAFLARAMLAPATALKGRGLPHIERYLREGLEHASYVIAAADAERRTSLVNLWRTAIPDLRNLVDSPPKEGYVRSNGH